MKEYPPTGTDSNSKNAENSKTIDSLIRNLVDFEKEEVQAAIEKVSLSDLQKCIISLKDAESEEPAEVMRQMHEKLERLKESVLQLQTRLRKRNKDD